jgi:Domain of unknown function (DUF4349)
VNVVSGVRRLRATVLALALVASHATPAFADGEQPKLVFSGRLVIEAASADAPKKVGEAAKAVGGILVSEGERDVTVDVPNERYRDFVKSLVPLGILRSESLHTEDVTDQAAAAAAQGRAAAQNRARLDSVGGTAHDVPQHLLLEQEVERVGSAKLDAEARLRALDRRTELTRVVVHVEVPAKETLPVPQLPFPWLGTLSLPRLLDTTSPPEEPSEVLRSFIDADLGFGYQRFRDASRFDDHSSSFALVGSFRMLGEAAPIGLYGGYDLALGGGGGFLYRVQPLFGLGVPIGHGVGVGLASGPGIDGITGGVMPFGVGLPIELDLSLDLTSFMALSFSAKDGWVLAASERKHGSDLAPFGDELALGAAVLVGPRSGGSYESDRIGARLGFVYHEILGTQVYEFTLTLAAHHVDYSY